MLILIRILVLSSLFSCLDSFAEITTVRFRESDSPDLGTRYIGIPISLSSDSSSAQFYCYDKDLIVNAQIDGTKISYRIFDWQKQILDISFPVDSLLRWNEDDGYLKQSVKFMFRNNKFFFIPGTKIDYNVKAYNRFPFMISAVSFKANLDSFPNTTLYFEINDSITVSAIVIRENGNLHKNEIKSGHIFKERYFNGDTVPINGRHYKIDEVDVQNAIVKLVHVDNESVASYIDHNIYKSIAQHFKNNDYLLIDFWATWCAPCINGLPMLKKLHDKYCDKISFLSVCFDELANKSRAIDLLSDKGIKWGSVFEDNKDKYSITRVMNITHFPTFVLLNRYGKIEAFLIGEGGLNALEAILSAKI